MEIIIVVISIIITFIIIYGIGRSLNTHDELIKMYIGDPLIVKFYIFSGLILFIILLLTLFAFNNTFWHLPYLFTK